mmetsp:Transcript_42288/g.68123  ORF Transcript_42288/g.68123 Transcript_42288/m.68123 type:complete len:551 (+) Transcript_42288:150-1802(+)
MGLADFRDIQMFAKGSFGRVFKGVRKPEGKMYALKQLNVQRMSRREKEETLNEVRLLASVVHRNILRFCEVFLEGKHLYIVTEYCGGGDVMSYITKYRGHMEPKLLWSIFIQTCQGVKALHEKNILHRDLKPQNILMTTSGRVKLADFGCSKIMKANRLALTQCGTPYYMSPELWKNQPYGKSSDVWSLGCILYHMATNRPPFDGYNMKDLANKIMYGRSPRLPKGKYSVDMNLMIKKMLEKTPSHRPSVAGILASDACKSRMFMLRDEDREKESDSKFELIGTIKLPSNNIARVRAQLPDSNYTMALKSPTAVHSAEANKEINRGSSDDAVNQERWNRKKTAKNNSPDRRSHQSEVASRAAGPNRRGGVVKSRRRIASRAGVGKRNRDARSKAAAAAAAAAPSHQYAALPPAARRHARPSPSRQRHARAVPTRQGLPPTSRVRRNINSRAPNAADIYDRIYQRKMREAANNRKVRPHRRAYKSDEHGIRARKPVGKKEYRWQPKNVYANAARYEYQPPKYGRKNMNRWDYKPTKPRAYAGGVYKPTRLW